VTLDTYPLCFYHRNSRPCRIASLDGNKSIRLFPAAMYGGAIKSLDGHTLFGGMVNTLEARS
jgi:hypothetical protein